MHHAKFTRYYTHQASTIGHWGGVRLRTWGTLLIRWLFCFRPSFTCIQYRPSFTCIKTCAFVHLSILCPSLLLSPFCSPRNRLLLRCRCEQVFNPTGTASTLVPVNNGVFPLSAIAGYDVDHIANLFGLLGADWDYELLNHGDHTWVNGEIATFVHAVWSPEQCDFAVGPYVQQAEYSVCRECVPYTAGIQYENIDDLWDHVCCSDFLLSHLRTGVGLGLLHLSLIHI